MIVAHHVVEKFAVPVELCKAALRDAGRPYKGLMTKPSVLKTTHGCPVSCSPAYTVGASKDTGTGKKSLGLF